jgi:hypothetical protein
MDPDGHRVCDYDCQTQYEAADPAYKHYCETCEWDVVEQRRNAKIAESILYGGTEFVASVLFEPADWAFTAYHCANGDCSGWMLLGMAPLIPSNAGKFVGKYGDELVALVGRKGFDTFDDLKAFLGPAGDGMEWHHIVEQSQIIKSKFPNHMIHNTGNVIAVEEGTHDLISKVYNTNIAGSHSGRVRNWLAGQSFAAQYQFGLQVLRNLGIIP